ncbi:MAG: XRE family transcriptional regulator [Clostridia bacterium BRH_c25]|nr:MAG: XRE family transcriptional regulator [Clostridia bacterium BRH_c25]
MDRDWKDIKKELLSNPEVKAEYDNLAIEYELIKQVIKARKEKDITQAELALKVGTKQSNISRLESGEYNPSLDFIQKVAAALDKKIEIKLV